jgi:hypothetical protein
MAQRDFVERLLSPLCVRLVPRLESIVAERGYDPFFTALGKVLNDARSRELSALESTFEVSALDRPPAAPAETQHLWG